MIQDIYPKKMRNEYDPAAQITAEDYVLCFDGIKLFSRVSRTSEIEFPVFGELREAAGREAEIPSGKASVSFAGISCSSEYTYLFTIDNERFFLAKKPLKEFAGFEYEDLRNLREKCVGPRYRMLAAYTAKHLSDWYRDTKYCGRCGKPMKHSETERAMTCTECGYTAYPRIMPAVIVGVTNGDRIIVTKYRRGYGHFALIAGFTEIGETAEETVSREVMEEVGIKVKNIRYYKSQPWGSANDLLLGFFCEADGSTEIRMDNNELKLAEWVKREEIELQPDDFSLTNEMMKMFKEGKHCDCEEQ